jgi:hypothetical protein
MIKPEGDLVGPRRYPETVDLAKRPLDAARG